MSRRQIPHQKRTMCQEPSVQARIHSQSCHQPVSQRRAVLESSALSRHCRQAKTKSTDRKLRSQRRSSRAVFDAVGGFLVVLVVVGFLRRKQFHVFGIRIKERINIHSSTLEIPFSRIHRLSQQIDFTVYLGRTQNNQSFVQSHPMRREGG